MTAGITYSCYLSIKEKPETCEYYARIPPVAVKLRHAMDKILQPDLHNTDIQFPNLVVRIPSTGSRVVSEILLNKKTVTV